MIRKIIRIDSEKCNGCGRCADACHENAIGMIDGKAKLLRDDYCDGLGDCLPACPVGAITFEEREAAAYDSAAVAAHQSAKGETLPCGCPGTECKSIEKQPLNETADVPGELSQWPVQIKLLPVTAPFYNGADILIAADCTAFAYGNFHRDFIRGRTTLVGCPKLDAIDYSEKLTAIFAQNDIKSVTVTRMHVPCCGGMEHAVKKAIADSGKDIALRIVTIAADGQILREITA
jgi:NAD-dependent dihydropyrimidine dehydrogenase PreA subunit